MQATRGKHKNQCSGYQNQNRRMQNSLNRRMPSLPMPQKPIACSIFFTLSFPPPKWEPSTSP